MKPVPTNDGFNHYEKKYMCENCCCCGPVHALTGAFAVGIFMVIGLVLNAVGSLANPGALILQFAQLACVALLFAGIKQLNPRYVLPFVVLMGIACAFSTIFLVLMILGSLVMNGAIIDYIKNARPEIEHQASENVSIAIMILVIGIVIIALCVVLNYWFFNITKRCYTYLKDYEMYRIRSGAVVLVQAPYSPPAQGEDHEAPPPYSKKEVV